MHPVNLALVVIGDGRRVYLEQAIRGIQENVLYPVRARIMVDDSGDEEYGAYLDTTYPEFIHVHGGRRGMAGAVQAGFSAVLDHDPDYVLWIEEDMRLIRPLPIEAALKVMQNRPWLAQMCFPREAIDPSEGDDQLAAIVAQAPNSGVEDDYTWQDFIFSMNPCLIPKRVLKLDWPSGPIGVGNEAGMTAKLLALGYVFGQWGHVGDPPWARHIGFASRSEGWAL